MRQEIGLTSFLLQRTQFAEIVATRVSSLIRNGWWSQIFEVVGALGRSHTGVNFDALDNQPVKLVMLFLVPQGQFQKHLHTLANIAKLLHKADFREALEKSPTAEAMLAVIKEHGKK